MFSTAIQNFLKRVPIPFIYGATGWIATEITVVLVPVIPSSIDGYSTVPLVAGLLFVAGAVKWIHSELLNIYPSLSGPSQATATTTASAASVTQLTPKTATSVPAAPSSYQTASGPAVSVNVSADSWEVSGSGFKAGTAIVVNVGNKDVGYVNVGSATTDSSGKFGIDIPSAETDPLGETIAQAKIAENTNIVVSVKYTGYGPVVAGTAVKA